MARASSSVRRLSEDDRLNADLDTVMAALGLATDKLSTCAPLSEEKSMPYEQIRKAYNFPFPLRNYQIDRLETHCASNLAGLYWEPGSGKTAGSTHWALWRSWCGEADQWFLLMPPILLKQWSDWLTSITDPDTGEPLSAAIYQGTPKQRAKVDLGRDFILMSYAVFKNDFERLEEYFRHRTVGGICDEGSALKNIESQNHKAVAEFFAGRHLSILTGTPLTHPADAYAYIKLLAPGVYRNRSHFERTHVAETGEHGKVRAWRNLDLMEQNLKINTSRVIRREVRAELPPVNHIPMVYDLAPAHKKLYNRIADERLVEFECGKEINAISASALRTTLQQVVLNWGDYAGDENLRPAALDLVDAVMAELGDKEKLVVVANFTKSNRMLLDSLKQYGAVAIYGDVSKAGKAQALHDFVHNPSCRVILLQPYSAGFGVDGLQKVCSEMLFLEAPTVAPPFHQTVARLDRDGQENPVNCRVAIAAGTVQVGMFRSLLDNDATVNSIQGGYKDLKESIFGS